MRYAYWLIGLSGLAMVACALVAQVHFARTAKFIVSNPPLAFIENVRAYQAYPWDADIRLQLWKSLVRAMFSPGADVTISRKTADDIYTVSRSTGAHPGLLFARLIYVKNTGCTQECAAIASELLDKHRLDWFVQKAADGY